MNPLQTKIYAVSLLKIVTPLKDIRMQHVIDLVGKNVSFIDSIKVEKKIYSQEISGTVTQVILDSRGNHEISVNDGDFYKVSELLEFQFA